MKDIDILAWETCNERMYYETTSKIVTYVLQLLSKSRRRKLRTSISIVACPSINTASCASNAVSQHSSPQHTNDDATTAMQPMNLLLQPLACASRTDEKESSRVRSAEEDHQKLLGGREPTTQMRGSLRMCNVVFDALTDASLRDRRRPKK